MGDDRLTYMLYPFHHHTYETVQNISTEEKLQFDEINSDIANALFHKDLRLFTTEQENRQYSKLNSNVYVVFIDICQA